MVGVVPQRGAVMNPPQEKIVSSAEVEVYDQEFVERPIAEEFGAATIRINKVGLDEIRELCYPGCSISKSLPFAAAKHQQETMNRRLSTAPTPGLDRTLVGLEAWEVALGISRREALRLVNERRLPAPDIRLSQKRVFWRTATLEKFLGLLA
jgi:hypothetical protein